MDKKEEMLPDNDTNQYTGVREREREERETERETMDGARGQREEVKKKNLTYFSVCS
jgi:hypothetical protein